MTRLMTQTDADAVFAANNRSAIGALTAFRTTGRRLPIIGFDDFDTAPLLQPAVSVVSQDVDLMGTIAARLLIDQLNGGQHGHESHILPTTLVLRGSERP
jgi:LacI family transcriptional regulator